SKPLKSPIVNGSMLAILTPFAIVDCRELSRRSKHKNSAPHSIISRLVKKAKKREGNFLVNADFHVIGSDVRLLMLANLLRTFIGAAHFQNDVLIYEKIAVYRQRDTM